MPKVVLTAPDGAHAQVYLHGAHVTSWVPMGGEERLFLSRKAEFRPGAAIRGGVPVIFPQFAREGPLPAHGFARVTTWEFAGVEASTARLQLRDLETTRRIWPHAFLTELAVTIGGRQLMLGMSVTNMGDGPFSFTCALHTYLRVSDIHGVVVEGLGGIRYRDQAAGRVERVQTEPELRFSGPVDRVYFEAPSALVVRDAERITHVTSSGFPDVVVWNPWVERGAALSDLEPEGYRRMVCIEAAVIGTPITLAPNERWQGSQTLLT